MKKQSETYQTEVKKKSVVLMASSMISSVAPVTRASPAQANMVAPFTGLKSIASFPVTRKLENDITSVASNGGRVQCMKVHNLLDLYLFQEKFRIYPCGSNCNIEYPFKLTNALKVAHFKVDRVA